MRRAHHLERFPLRLRRPWAAYPAVAGFVALAFLLRWQLDDVLPPGFPFVTFLPAVVLSSFLFGRGPGICAAIVSGILAWYYFVPPFGSLALSAGTGLALAFYLTVVTIDIALIDWMQRANARVARERERSAELAAHTELLFGELQHRVSNNLQMVGAVLSLQLREVTDPAARQALEDAVAKLQLIGRIQRQLYSTRGELVAMDLFLAELAADLIVAAGKPGVSHTLEAAADLSLPPEAAIPLALIMAEAVANAIEHGFAGEGAGTIRIALTAHDDRIELRVADDGAGLPDGFDLQATTSLGLDVALTLARQLAGTLSLEPGSAGAVMRLSMPRASFQAPLIGVRAA